MAQARIEAVVRLTMSEVEARDTIRAILEGVEDTDSDEPANGVARVLMKALGVKIRVQERVPVQSNAPQEPPTQGRRKGRVAPPPEPTTTEEE